MEILIANNVDVDQEHPQLGTPLYVACMNQKTDCARKLLELGTYMYVWEEHSQGFYLGGLGRLLQTMSTANTCKIQYKLL